MKKLSIFGFIITTLLTTHLANACIESGRNHNIYSIFKLQLVFNAMVTPTEPCLRFSRTRLFNETFAIKARINTLHNISSVSVMDSIVGSVDIDQNSCFSYDFDDLSI